jgi:hypothetical protein
MTKLLLLEDLPDVDLPVVACRKQELTEIALK